VAHTPRAAPPHTTRRELDELRRQSGRKERTEEEWVKYVEEKYK
jgi:hypothetical protein